MTLLPSDFWARQRLHNRPSAPACTPCLKPAAIAAHAAIQPSVPAVLHVEHSACVAAGSGAR